MEDEDLYTRITLRIPKDLHQKLSEQARSTSKSLNAEIVGRLTNSFTEDGPAVEELAASVQAIEQRFERRNERFHLDMLLHTLRGQVFDAEIRSSRQERLVEQLQARLDQLEEDGDTKAARNLTAELHDEAKWANILRKEHLALKVELDQLVADRKSYDIKSSE